jgi:selenocysteine lyase/cysteine desulfurase
VDNLDARDLVNDLSRQRINTAASLKWYGLLDFTDKHVESAIRISPHYYNTEEEVDLVVNAVGRAVHARAGSTG